MNDDCILTDVGSVKTNIHEEVQNLGIGKYFIGGHPCGLNYAVGAPVEKEVDCVISNTLGFGGHKVSLHVKRFEE